MLSNTLSRALGSSENRSIRVRVIAGGHEVDSFEASGSDTLRAAIRPIYAHLPLLDASVQFSGVEEERGPLGFRRSRRMTDLSGPSAALAYLGEQPDLDLPNERPARAAKREKVAPR